MPSLSRLHPRLLAPVLALFFMTLAPAPEAAGATQAEQLAAFDQRVVAALEKASPEAAGAWKEANAARDHGDLAAARDGYARVHALVPSSPHPLRRECQAEAALQHRDSALSLCREALDLERSSENLASTAEVLASPPRRTGEVDRAATMAREAMDAAPGDAFAFQSRPRSPSPRRIRSCSAAPQPSSASSRPRIRHDVIATLSAGFDGHLDEARSERRGPRPRPARRRLPRPGGHARPGHAAPDPHPLRRVEGGARVGGRVRGPLAAGLIRAAPRCAPPPACPPRRTATPAAQTRRCAASTAPSSGRVARSIRVAPARAPGGGAGRRGRHLRDAGDRHRVHQARRRQRHPGLRDGRRRDQSVFARRVDEEPGAPLDLAEQPGLRAVLDEVAAKIGTRPVDTVYMTPFADIAVMSGPASEGSCAGRASAASSSAPA